MLFNSYPFIFLFLPITVIVFWLLLRHLGRGPATGWLLLMSVLFYGCVSMRSLAIVIPSILLDYGIARCMLQENCTERVRRILLICGICLNVIFLGYFKYKNFFLDVINSGLGLHFPLSSLFLPVGISFLVFQKIAFLLDVQAGELKTVKCLDYLLFALFFPRTIAGPIVRYQEVVPQFSRVSPDSAKSSIALGLSLFSIGLFKKAVLADSVGRFVPGVFDGTPELLSTDSPGILYAWVALLAYTFQLYFDFSGYSDMALGVARMVGVQLPINFNSPFKATSIVEFWNRWHMTLTRFLTAYIYTPIVLHMSRVRMDNGKPLLYGGKIELSTAFSLVAFPTLVTMTLSGLWHGAGWQFIAWGALHGVYLTVNQCWRMWQRRWSRNNSRHERMMMPVYRAFTFTSVVFALVLFRANSIGAAKIIWKTLLGFNGMSPHFTRLVEQVGVSFSWSTWWETLPWVAFGWITASFLIVMCLPNSQEYVSRLEVIFDLPKTDETTHASVLRNGVHVPMYMSTASLMASIVGIMCAFGVMAIGDGGGFIYGAF